MQPTPSSSNEQRALSSALSSHRATTPSIPQQTSLQTLILSGQDLTNDEIISQVAQYPDLRVLDLSGTQITDKGIPVIAKSCLKLREVSLGGTQVTDKGVRSLATCSQLETLVLSGQRPKRKRIKVTRVGIKSLIACPRLKALHLKFNSIGDAGAQLLGEALANHNTFKVLDLSGNGIGDRGLETVSFGLTKDSSLTSLALSDNSMSAQGVRFLGRGLASNNSLKFLDISSNEIGSEGAKRLCIALGKNSTLQTLNVACNGIGDEGGKALGVALTKNSILTRLNLSTNSIGDGGAKLLSRALTSNRALTSLNVNYNYLSDAGAYAIGASLPKNSTLQVLKLGWNDIHDPGAAGLAEALKSNTSLTILHFHANKIKVPGIQALSAALLQNTSLTELSLRSSKLDGTGLLVLSEAVKQNSSLKILNLSFNAIQSAGLSTFAAALVSNQTLTSLHLRRNQIEESGAQDLVKVLDHNSSLTRLDLTGNPIPPESPTLISIEQALLRNQTKPFSSAQERFALPPLPPSPPARPVPPYITELHDRLNRCFAEREPDPFAPIFARFNALLSQCTRAEKSLLAKLLPQLHPFTSLFSDEQRKALITAKILNAKHLSLAPYYALERELIEAGKAATTPALKRQILALQQRYQEQLGKLLTAEDRKAFLQPKAQLFYRGHYLIDRSQALKLLCCDASGTITRKNKTGSLPISISHGIRFKVEAEGFPALDHSGEPALSSLCHLLSPNEMIAAPTTLLSIRTHKAKAYVQASLTIGGPSNRPTAIPLDELLGTIESFHLLRVYFGSNRALRAQWQRLLSWAREEESSADPKAVLKNYLHWMERHPSESRAKEFQEGALPIELSDLNRYPLPIWTKLLKLLKQEPGLMEGHSIKTLLRFSPSLIWISKLFEGANFVQIANKLPILLDRVDRDALSRLFLASLMVNPHDGKADNYMCAIDWKAGSIESLRIIAIDNDLAFEPPILKANDNHHIRTKCLLYALPPKLLKTTIGEKVRKDIGRMEALDLLLDWITRLDQYQSQSEIPSSLKLPKQALVTAFYNLNKIQLLLNEEVTLKALFRQVEPVLFYAHQEALRQGKGISEAFALLVWEAGLPLEKLLEKTFARADYKGKTLSLQEAYQRAAQSEPSRTTVVAATQAALDEAALFIEDRHYHPIANLSFVDQLKVKLRSPQELLLSSIRAGHIPLTRLALLNGADPNKCNQGHPPLHQLIPCRNNGEEILKCLVSFGANLEWRDPKKDQTLLDLAANGAHIELFIALARAGAGRDCQSTQVLAFVQKFIEKPGMREALRQLERQCHRIGWLQDLPVMLIHRPDPSSVPLQRARLKNDGQVEVTPTYLHPSVVKQIGITDHHFPDKPKRQFGRHTVASIEHQGRKLTFKDHPEMAGNEFLVSSLHRMIIGHGTPYSELFKAQDSYGDAYPVQASQTIEGTNFRDVFYGPDRATKLALLDQHRLHNLILLAILTRPEDGKSEQYIYSPLTERKFQLTCVDNDHAFVRPFEGRKLMVKCVLFCLDQMQEPINPQTRELFLNLDPEVFLRRWLLDCASQNRLYTALFDKRDRQAQIEKNADPLIIQMFLPERTTAKIFEALTRIQEALKEEAITPLNLLLYAIPQLGRYYEQLFSPRYKSPRQRWQAVKKVGSYVNDASGGEHTCTSTLDLLKHFRIDPRDLLKHNPAYFIDQGQADLVRLKTEQRLITSIKSELLQGKAEGFKSLLLDQSREKALQGYPFGKKVSYDKKIFQAIRSIQASFFHLDLSNKKSCSLGEAWVPFTLTLTFSPFLRSLKLDRCEDVSAEFLWGLSELCPHLKRLSLVECSSLADLWTKLASRRKLTFSNLQHLNLQGSTLKRFHIRAVKLATFDISNSKQLKRLSLDLPLLQRAKLDGCTKLSLKELKRVAKQLKRSLITATECPVLKSLQHHSLIEQNLPLIFSPLNSFGERLRQAILGLTLNQAKTVDLNGDYIGGYGAEALSQALERNSSLTKLVIGLESVGALGVIALLRTLEHSSSLTDLHLVGASYIGDSGATAFSRVLEHNSLTTLNLCHNSIGESGATALSQALKHNSSLTTLNLCHNSINSSGATALSQALKHNSSLTDLNLRDNSIGESGATALSEGLKLNSSLTSLNLTNNGIGPPGATAFSRALEHNSSLTSLYLERNKIGVSGATALSRALEHNSSLTSLYLKHNRIGPLGAKAFSRALEHNSSLTSLYLFGSNVRDSATRQAIERSLNRNKEQAKARTRQADASSSSSGDGKPSKKGKEGVG